MILNYFKIAYRHLMKRKVYSIINVMGLAVGMAAFYLIVEFISFEISYDSFHSNVDDLFRVTYLKHENGEITNTSVGTFFGVGPFLTDHFPEVKNSVHFYKWPANTGVVLRCDNKVFNERNYFFAEADFFLVFPSLLLQGDAATCLKNPNSIVLSRRMAQKMFGVSDALGKMVSTMDKINQSLIVTGVMQDIPENSHFDLDIVIPYERDWRPEQESYWKYPSNWTYITLAPGTNVHDLQNRLNSAVQKEQKDNPDFKGASLVFQSIKDIHFYSHLKREIKTNGSVTLVYALGAAAIIILILAWINYINLETSQLLARVREVGVRRIIGSSRLDLMLQFLIQYVCLSFLAILIAAGIVYQTTPYFHFITGARFISFDSGIPWIWSLASSIVIFGAMISGVYPVLLMIRFNPVQSLKGKIGNFSGVLIRKSLLSFQFVSSITLLAFLLVIDQQLKFMRTADKNIDLDQVITVYNTTNHTYVEDSLRKEKNDLFRNRLLQQSAITNLSTSSAIPGEPIGFTYVDLAKRSMSDPDRQIPYKVVYIDYNFIPLFGLKLKAGRNYSEESGDRLCLVISEKTVRELGFSSIEKALDKEIFFLEDEWEKWRIIGVVEDYRHESMKSPIYPTIFRLHRNKGQMVYYSIRLNAGANPTEAVAFAEKTWKEVWPEKAFDYFFMDQHYDQQYKSEIYFSRIFGLFAGVAIFLACLGVLGITLFETNARLKEISIRKVLGATVANLVTLLSRAHLRVVIISSVVSIPLIFFLANGWLAGYPVRIELSLWVFIIPLVVILLLVGLTSSFQTLKAANSNPVNHLRNE